MDLPFKLIQTNDIERWRANTFWTKEPETIAWIDSFNGNGSFWDIGANIGIYSLYAATKYPEMTVYAFEPSELNVNRLKQNCIINNLKNIMPLRIALSNILSMGRFIDTQQVGGADGKLLVQPITGDIPISTIDDLVLKNNMKEPVYIKIDVDGGEFAIIEGAIWTLAHDWCKSLLIEVDPTCTNKMLLNKIMHLNGYTTNNIFNVMDNHSRYRRLKENIIVENVIYTKE